MTICYIIRMISDELIARYKDDYLSNEYYEWIKP